MSKIFSSKLTKEDFKRALSSCYKEMWVLHSQENFNQALLWNKNKVLQFNLKNEISEEGDFDSSGSSIDLFETYFKIFESENDSENLENAELRKKWKEKWLDLNDNSALDVDGFDLTKFEGESIIDGNLVGEAAKQYFESLNIQTNLNRNQKLKTFDLSGLPFVNAVEKTKELINSKEYEYLFEAAFEYDDFNLRTRCDILEINNHNDTFKIIEIKATSKVKEDHFFDLMYQYFILEKNGLKINDVALGHIRSNYIRGQDFNEFNLNLSEMCEQLIEDYPIISFEECLAEINGEIIPENYLEADDLNYNGFFIIDELSYGESQKRLKIFELIKIFESQFEITEIIKQITELLSLGFEDSLNLLLSNNCSTVIKKNLKNKFVKISESDNPVYCHHVIAYFDKNKENIFNFTNINKKTKALIHYESQKIYLDEFKSLFDSEIPVKPKDKSTYFRPENFRHFEVYKKFHSNPATFRDEDIIFKEEKNILESLLAKYTSFPIYMYDFETVKWAIPKYNNSKSYQQIPFQYSIDVLTDKNYDYKKPETMKHFDFLANSSDDPRPEFIKNFLKDIFSCGKGIYVAYNDSFEKMVLKQMAVLFPKYQKSLIYIVQNTIDLMDFFKGNSKKSIPWFLIYHPAFHGSYSIKKTQPALDNSFNYNDLSINKGDKASQTFREFSDGNISSKIWNSKIRPDMIKYCNRDTLAMVVVLQRIKEIFKNWQENN
ncbi:DUF2779 domain-containing protein [Spiroplasma alleghenense]|uniref:DUF2779 domain-containing protein n=1 Tax=Spiroplasma alleghenense TaxID=216931 RepID=A0A345Z3A3_9MOLU|nr:DUF2779 domain-containing protein [Spiroplasma alleghenense]AXK51082.1 hypothetical protein SALLE_v1c04080 [Spiroplasma alleghenense]